MPRRAAHQGEQPPNHADPYRRSWEQRRIMMCKLKEHDKAMADSIRRFDHDYTLGFILSMVAVMLLLLAHRSVDDGTTSFALLGRLLCDYSAATKASAGAAPTASGGGDYYSSTQSFDLDATSFTTHLSALAIASISLAIFVTGYAVFLLLSHQLGRRLAAPWHLHPGGTAAVSFIVKTATILVLVFMVKQG